MRRRFVPSKPHPNRLHGCDAWCVDPHCSPLAGLLHSLSAQGPLDTRLALHPPLGGRQWRKLLHGLSTDAPRDILHGFRNTAGGSAATGIRRVATAVAATRRALRTAAANCTRCSFGNYSGWPGTAYHCLGCNFLPAGAALGAAATVHHAAAWQLLSHGRPLHLLLLSTFCLLPRQLRVGHRSWPQWPLKWMLMPLPKRAAGKAPATEGHNKSSNEADAKRNKAEPNKTKQDSLKLKRLKRTPMPKKLVGCVPCNDEGQPLCFAFNLGTCASSSDCPKGLHMLQERLQQETCFCDCTQARCLTIG